MLGILPNKAYKGTRSRILMDPQTSKPEDDYFRIRPQGTEIPKCLNLNHESDGNVVSFLVGHKFPNIFCVCIAFGLLKYPRPSSCYVYLSINYCEKEHLILTSADRLSDHLWISSLSNKRLQNQLNKSNPSELNYVEVICGTKRLNTTNGRVQWVVMDWVKNHPRGWGSV